MELKDKIRNREFIMLDGSMGAILIAKGLGGSKSHRLNVEQPDVITDIHRQYFEAGCDIVLTNTFNITPESMQKANLTVEETVQGAVAAAQAARKEFPERYIALNLGPTGKLLEPYGQHPYEAAYDYYQMQIEQAYHDVDLFVIETISDITEMQAAIKACCNLSEKPILAAMTFTSKAKTWLGVPLQQWADLINDSDIDAGGINCTLTPEEMFPIITELQKLTKKPLFAEPNRGQPETDGEHTIYRMPPEIFADGLKKFYDSGIHILGGCCGSDPVCMKTFRQKIL